MSFSQQPHWAPPEASPQGMPQFGYSQEPPHVPVSYDSLTNSMSALSFQGQYYSPGFSSPYGVNPGNDYRLQSAHGRGEVGDSAKTKAKSSRKGSRKARGPGGSQGNPSIDSNTSTEEPDPFYTPGTVGTENVPSQQPPLPHQLSYEPYPGPQLHGRPGFPTGPSHFPPFQPTPPLIVGHQSMMPPMGYPDPYTAQGTFGANNRPNPGLRELPAPPPVSVTSRPVASPEPAPVDDDEAGYHPGATSLPPALEESSAFEELQGAVPEDGDGANTPRAITPPIAALSGQYGYSGAPNPVAGRVRLDNGDRRFVVEPSHKFQPGMVFKILWTEPIGSADKLTDCQESSVKGERFYSSYRRFIVVANDEGHCTCVPILTYERRACTKRGVKPQKHGIAYHIGGRPRMLEGEPDLGFLPIRFQNNHPAEKLAKESRINYSKLVTIEHNYQVLFIGRIHPDDYANIVVPAVDKCWRDKNRQSGDARHY